jgi:hypothetical protein
MYNAARNLYEKALIHTMLYLYMLIVFTISVIAQPKQVNWNATTPTDLQAAGY